MAKDPRQPGRGLEPRQWVALGVILLLLIFILENTKRVQIRLVVPSVHMPVALALLLAVVGGIGIGFLIGRRRHHDD